MAESAYDLLRSTASKPMGEYEGLIATDLLGRYTEETLHGSNASPSIAHPANQVVQLNALVTKRLNEPLTVMVEIDVDGFVATTEGLPLYGYGDRQEDAVEMLLQEIEDLNEELTGGGEFTEDWDAVKEFLGRLIK